MSELYDLYRHLSTLPSDVVGTLTCFCLNHHSTLTALSMLPLSARSFATTLRLTGMEKHILCRWLMRNPAGAHIVANVINDCDYDWQLADMVDMLCEPAGKRTGNSADQDAPPTVVPNKSLFDKKMATHWQPALLLLRELCGVKTFDAARLCTSEQARSAIVHTLHRWEQHRPTCVTETACHFGANIDYDPRWMCSLIASSTQPQAAVVYLLRLFHSCPTRIGREMRLETKVLQLWRDKKQTIALTLGLFEPTILATMIGESERFMREVSRLRTADFDGMTQLIEDHLTWVAINESEQTDAARELQKSMAIDAEQESIKRAYAAALSQSGHVIRCVSCAKPFDPDVMSYSIEQARREHVCASCAPAVRACVCCKTSTRGALCMPDQELAIPLCCDCYRDRQSTSSIYRSPMQWPRSVTPLCSVRCETCLEPILLRADQFCSTTSVLASTSGHLRNDVCIETFGRVTHVHCLATCETCSVTLDIAKTRIINGMPYCKVCWMVCPGCREPVLCSVACSAPSSRRPPNERCYHRQRESPDIDADEEEEEDNTHGEDDLAGPESPGELDLFA